MIFLALLLLLALYCGDADGGGGDQESPIHKPEQMVNNPSLGNPSEARETGTRMSLRKKMKTGRIIWRVLFTEAMQKQMTRITS